MHSNLTSIEKFLTQLDSLPSDSIEHLLPTAHLIQLKPHQILMPAHTRPLYWYIVQQGLLRAVYNTEQGKEFSKEFYWESDMIFGMRSLISTQPLPYSIVAVEPCNLVQLPIEQYRQLVSATHAWKAFHIKQLETHLLFKEVKEELLLLNSNEQKVKLVYQNFPDFVRRVPATLVATYLGLSPVSLSRIKKRLNL